MSQDKMPSKVSGDELRAIMGHVPTPVTVVTTVSPAGGKRAMTIGSFGSVSLSPPLISFSVMEDSDTLKVLEEARFFAVHILGDDQADESNHFANSKQTEDEMFGRFPMTISEDGVPLLDKSLGILYCKPHSFLAGGDHTIVLGEVVSVTEGAGEGPLLYYSRSYRKVGEKVG